MEEVFVQSTSPEFKQVSDAISDARWDFRTIGGISRQTGLPESVVQHVLDTHPERFRRSEATTGSGEVLYTRGDRPVRLREQLSSFVTALRD